MRQLIYRVQDDDGRGPFKPGFTNSWLIWREDLQNLLPCYEEFGRMIKPSSEFHQGNGCLTVRQLQRWFTQPEYAILKTYGYSAVEIVVDQVVFSSDIQCVFIRRKKLSEDIKKFELYGGLK